MKFKVGDLVWVVTVDEEAPGAVGLVLKFSKPDNSRWSQYARVELLHSDGTQSRHYVDELVKVQDV